MGSKSRWTAKLAFVFYLALLVVILFGGLSLRFILSSVMKIDVLEPPFPTSFLFVPVLEVMYLIVTLLFARYKGASLEELGLKKARFNVLIIISVVTVPVFLLGLGINILEQMVFGPDPMAEIIAKAGTPRNSFQLVAMVAMHLSIVAPCEELAFRGFIQKGFENSFGGRKGLLIASALFGLSHGLNTPYAIAPTFVASLFLGYAWQRTGGNTTVSTLMHGVNNSISIIALYFLLRT